LIGGGQKHNTILFKFRNHAASSLPSSISLPSFYPRVFDIKKAIVKASGLDRGKTSDFDLIIRNAVTGESYDDELMRLGLRQQEEVWKIGEQLGTQMTGKGDETTSLNLIVERIPAARGQGLLARIVRADCGLNFAPMEKYGNPDAARKGFYEYRIKDEDEFVYEDAHPRLQRVPMMMAKHNDEGICDHGVNSSIRNNISKGTDHLEVSAPVSVDDSTLKIKKVLLNVALTPQKVEQDNMPKVARLQVPPLAKNREKTVQQCRFKNPLATTKCGSHQEIKRDSTTMTLEYALHITATNIPYFYQCGICAGVAKDALFIPWDDKGRTTCDHCMRQVLYNSMLCCPLTGDKVNSYDLRPNKPLQKAIKQFVGGVMEKAQEVNRQQGVDTKLGGVSNTQKKGVVIGKEISKGKDGRHGPKSLDDFGGDPFCVSEDGKETKKRVENQTDKTIGEKSTVDINNTSSKSVAVGVDKNNTIDNSLSRQNYFDSYSHLSIKRSNDAISKSRKGINRQVRLRTNRTCSNNQDHFYKGKFIPSHY